MKNCNIGRGIAVLLTSTVLLGGCSSTEQAIEEKRVPIDNCRHVIVNFGNQKIIFKECEGQDDFNVNIYIDDNVRFTVDDETGSVLAGRSGDYTSYSTNHQLTNEMEQKSVEEGAQVYKITKITGAIY